MNRNVMLWGYIIFIMAASFKCAAQQASVSSVDILNSIAISPALTEDSLPQISRNTLWLKLKQIVGINNISAFTSSSRFVLTAILDVQSKDIIASAPPMVALNLEATFYIGDARKEKVFATMIKSLKGVGTNEIKAYNDAINSIKVDAADMQRFVEQGKLKVTEYFRTRCSEVIAEAKLLATAKEYDEAIYTLMSVPSECKECFNKCLDELPRIVKLSSVYNCAQLLIKAKTIWATSMNERAADSAAAILNKIDKNMNPECEKELRSFINEMAKTMKERNDKEWHFKEKSQDVKNEMADDMINTYRQIAIEYARSHSEPQVYNISTWHR